MPSDKVLEAVTGRKIQKGRPMRSKQTVPPLFRPADPQVAQLQDDVRDGVDSLVSNTPFKDGKIVEVEFTTVERKNFAHGLSGEAKGFLIVDLTGTTAAVSLIRETLTSADPLPAALRNTHIRIRATGACKAKLWVWR